MLETLFAAGQIACVTALLYGGWLSIANAGCMEAGGTPRREGLAPRSETEDWLARHHYLAWDA